MHYYSSETLRAEFDGDNPRSTTRSRLVGIITRHSVPLIKTAESEKRLRKQLKIGIFLIRSQIRPPSTKPVIEREVLHRKRTAEMNIPYLPRAPTPPSYDHRSRRTRFPWRPTKQIYCDRYELRP
ncbi:hypothetical protein M404DRAFT_1004840 [Pisolithus tinctorius Marx 270]|uniref:Uncharacterized protein n=1 Tax=Pisolithus tinctorius Marx 270 TaxID=870435 RepID=A0A0C3IQD0_PISTI|nr:hypothetical protein M404DRAFT_1004840 [Pisolithus tinctorius Marx 270]